MSLAGNDRPCRKCHVGRRKAGDGARWGERGPGGDSMFPKYRVEEECEAVEAKAMSQPRPAKRVVVPRPDRIRRLGGAGGFGWLDARLVRERWLERLGSEELAVYVFLCLVADRQGVSWYRRDRIREALGLGERAVWEALDRLEQLDLVAYQPFHRHASEGFRQVLDLPEPGPCPGLDRSGGER